MEAVPVTRARLESLTTSDLIKMADNLGIDIPPDLDRIFIIEELLEIAASDKAVEDAADTADIPTFPGEGSEEHSGVPKVPPEGELADCGLIESVPLPKQYNITFIEVMIRDPLWAFVFWEIKAQDKEQFERTQEFDGYYLKVSPWVVPEGTPKEEGVFRVSVSPGDTAWYLGLSPVVEGGNPREDQGQYKVELCAGFKGNETVLAVSKPFKLPFLHELPAGKEPKAGESRAWENPLVRLSGYEDFHILRNNERLFRAKRGASAGSYE